jgi:hypothetical protein
MTLSSSLEFQKFAQVFLPNYLVGGLGSLSKRELDLLVLRAYLEAKMGLPIQAAITKADPYQLGRDLNIRASRIRTMLDDLRYRYPPLEDELRSQLSEALRKGEIGPGKNSLRIQIDDMLLRDYVRKFVRDIFGIVDTSFDRTIISLTPENFLALAVWTQDPDTKKKIEEKLQEIELKPDTEAPKEERVHWFIKKIGEGAATQLGKEIIVNASKMINSDGESLVDHVVSLFQKLFG